MKFQGVLLMFAILLSCCQAGVSDNLTGHWRFEDVEQPQRHFPDLSGNQANAEPLHDPRFVKSGSRNILEFDGIEQGLRVISPNFFQLREQITTMVWLKATHLRGHTVIFGVPNSNPDWTTPVFGMYATGGFVVYGQFGDGKTGKALLECSVPIPLHEWVCLTATSDGEHLALYVNGTLDRELQQRTVLANNGKPLLIGKGLGNKLDFKGLLGELRIYNRSLSATEVTLLYNETKSSYAGASDQPSVRDDTVIVETHGSNPEGATPWRKQQTRLLENLNGFDHAATSDKVNRYGGALELPREAATGFFRTQKIDGRWWLIDPEGYRFYNVGLSTVSEPLEVQKRFGSPEAWAENLTDLLRENGFNGLGNNSSQLLQSTPQPLVWVLRHNFLFSFAKAKGLHEPASGTYGFPDRCMPVFHPDFPAWCEEYGKELRKTADDPMLLGIMTENEIQCPANLLDRFLALDRFNPDLKPGCDAATAWLKKRVGVDDITGIVLDRRLRYQFIAYAFEHYYKIVVPIVRKYDPNHLYLGSRINYGNGQFDNPWFWRMLPKYHDVVSVNYYSRWGADKGELSDWAQWSGLPIIFTEWYAKALDVEPKLANTHGAGWVVRTQEDRARYYQHFALAALETPIVVGWHFFKYRDDPPHSRALDSMGGANKGMFNLYGQPYAPLLQRAGAVNRVKYALINFFDKRRRDEKSTDTDLKPAT